MNEIITIILLLLFMAVIVFMMFSMFKQHDAARKKREERLRVEMERLNNQAGGFLGGNKNDEEYW